MARLLTLFLLFLCVAAPACSDAASPDGTSSPGGDEAGEGAEQGPATGGPLAHGNEDRPAEEGMNSLVVGTLVAGEVALEELALCIRFVVYGPGGDRQMGGERTFPVEPDGRFELAVPPGEFLLLVRDRAHGTLLWQGAPFFTEEDATYDAGTVDVGGRIVVRSVAVASSTGEPLPFFRLRHPDSSSIATDKPRQNPARVLVGELVEARYEVIAPGHLTGFVQVDVPEQEVVLEPGVQVVVQASGTEALEERGTVFLRFDRLGLPKGEALNLRAEVALDEQRRGSVRLPTTGEWVVTLNAATTTDSGLSYKQNVGQLRFRVDALEFPEVLELPVDPDREKTFLEAEL